MKNSITVMVNIVLGVLLLLIVATVAGRMNRGVEVEGNLSSVTEETVSHMALEASYDIANNEEAMADFMEHLIERLDASADVSMEVEAIEKEQGILAVKVTESFCHPNGKKGTVSDSRIVILNHH